MCRRAGAKESGSKRERETESRRAKTKREDGRETWSEDREIEGERERKLGGE